MDAGSPELIRNFAIALFIGALVGLDREKKKAAEQDIGLGGIRTFILFAMAGAISGWLSSELGNVWIFIATVGGVSASVIVGYVIQARESPAYIGLTTEIAAIVVCLLGGLTLFGYPGVAVALGIGTSAILAFKQPIHGLVGRIGSDDLYAGLKLLIATFIVLPLLPNEAIDPIGALNPYRLWLLVILISSLSLVGYVAVRVLGPGRGTALTGLFGGLVSSTAVTLAFSKRSREEAGHGDVGDVLAAGILLAWVLMFVRVVVEVVVVHISLLPRLLPALGVMGAVSLVAAGWFLRRDAAARRGGGVVVEGRVPLRNPFSLTSAIKFAAFFAAVLVVVKLVETYLPGQGFYAVAGLAGLTDVDAITLSMANYAREGGDPTTAANAIVTAVLTNTMVKAGLTTALATAALRRRVVGATAAILAAGILVLVAG